MYVIEDLLANLVPTHIEGTIARTAGSTAAAAGLPVAVGAEVEIQRQMGPPVAAEVIGFQDELTLLFPLSSMSGVRRGHRVRLRRTAAWVAVGDALLGRVTDASGRTIDDLPPPVLTHRVPRQRPAPSAVSRPAVAKAISTGVRAIDGLLTCGLGQRMGIFAGAGVGKSVLLASMARSSSADVNVIALVGERGREVNDFIHRELGPEGMANSVVVVATSDQPAPMRLRAAFTATAIAEYFRDQGRDVLLLMDSMTRVAMAQREIGLAAGEPPATRGYPPSVYGVLPQLIERTGATSVGTITAFYSVLVEGDDPQEPVSDILRGLLDGHCTLSSRLAAEGHYPAIDVVQSVSRLMPSLATEDQLAAACKVRRLLAAYREHEDLISVGAYRPGTNMLVDEAIAMRPMIDAFLVQQRDESSDLASAHHTLQTLAATTPRAHPPKGSLNDDWEQPKIGRQHAVTRHHSFSPNPISLNSAPSPLSPHCETRFPHPESHRELVPPCDTLENA
ncbi:MAG: FliI/YscN family ATPase [Planctomycetales bacterium]|nr:FliI/YscN family ATPase [Planctomycetales bacterium]NIM08650.1 FliI/YscN family ATPase [Planctomycetales bacterium]NIN08120.1 FliI/YscN family ATPase [Planctomycetales bacterium]NIN77245.1 FliI/YscN family ATPase [Planctomycetales bacterium]NIO34434.1 FliI/YscN family ATPase [Planctomycetales bacterium]